MKAKNWYIHSIKGDRAVINKSEDGKNAIMSPVKTSDIALVGATPAETYRIHTVVHGDTLWGIAQKYLGKGSRYPEIVKLNDLKSNVIYTGMKLKIPKITGIRAEDNHRLVFCFADGTDTVKRWEYRSRAESWTPEMKEAARQRRAKQPNLERGWHGYYLKADHGKEEPEWQEQ